MQEKTINQQYKELNEKILDKVFGMALDGHEAGTFPKEPYLDVSSGHYGKWQALKLVVRHNQCQVAIYFDHRIRISVLMHKKAEFRNQAWYTLIDPNSEDEKGCLVQMDPPEDPEEYIRILSDFLFAFLNLAVRIKANPSKYRVSVPRCYAEPDFPFHYSNEETAYDEMCKYPYSWERKDELEYMTQVWNSKKFNHDIAAKTMK